MKKTTRTIKTVKDTRTGYQAGLQPAPVRRTAIAHKAHGTPVDISIPEPVFQAMQQLAVELDVPLSELYTTALTTYLAGHGGVTGALDRLYATESSELDAVLVSVQAALLKGERW
jgi:hypothetical protein